MDCGGRFIGLGGCLRAVGRWVGLQAPGPRWGENGQETDGACEVRKGGFFPL